MGNKDAMEKIMVPRLPGSTEGEYRWGSLGTELAVSWLQQLCSTRAHRAHGGGSALVPVSWFNSQEPGCIGIGEVVHASGRGRANTFQPDLFPRCVRIHYLCGTKATKMTPMNL